MRNFYLLLFLSFFTLTLSAQNSKDSLKASNDSLQINYANFLKEVQGIRTETKTVVKTLTDSLDTLHAQTSDRLKKAENTISDLEKEISTLKKIDSVVLQSKKDILKKRYDLASKTILPGMIRGVIFVKRLSQFNQIEQKINLTTSPWNDKDLRDGFDKLKDWTPFFGVVGAGVPLLTENADAKTVAISGIAAMAIPQIIAWIGKSSKKTETTANKMKSKMEFLNVSRSAYDDLFQRNLEIRKIYEADSTLQSDLEKLQSKIDSNPNPTDTTMSNQIFEIQNYLSRFDVIRNQIPQYLMWTKDIINKYKSYPEIYDQIKGIENDIDNFLIDYYDDFDKMTSIPFTVKKELFMPSE